MMKTLIAPALAALLLAGCSNDKAETTSAPAATDSAASPATTSGPDNAAASSVVTATATGKVESVDADGGRIVIAHGPVEALQWPAMTMGFKATPEQIQSVQAGQDVEFEFSSQGPENSITRISPTR